MQESDRFLKIKLLVLDVDGVLTDGKLYYNENGENQKVFDVKDGLGIKLANKIMTVALMSGNPSPIIDKRAQDLDVQFCFTGITDKYQCLKALIEKLSLNKEEIAYIGDDLNDLVVRELVELLICPQDAHSTVQEKADIVLKNVGGNGAVREFIDLILNSQDFSSVFKVGVRERNI